MYLQVLLACLRCCSRLHKSGLLIDCSVIILVVTIYAWCTVCVLAIYSSCAPFLHETDLLCAGCAVVLAIGCSGYYYLWLCWPYIHPSVALATTICGATHVLLLLSVLGQQHLEIVLVLVYEALYYVCMQVLVWNESRFLPECWLTSVLAEIGHS